MQYIITKDKLRNDKMSQVTLRKGYWFIFEHEANDISLQGSIWTGKETAYFNNKPVSSFRNISNRKSEHTFSEKGHAYKLCTSMTNVLRGTLKVDLYCDDELIQTESVSQFSKMAVKLAVWILSALLIVAWFDQFDLFSRLSRLF
ncbi:MAG: putative membrane protein [Paraglaciecola sp.]|jgi:uncharacterized membrane protein